MQKLTSLFAAVFIGFAVLGLTAPQVRAAPILDVVGGQLTGARNVSVLGALYDVEFKDGTCIDLFMGCDEFSDFAFATEAGATAAAQALLDLVFLDGIGLFDSDAALTEGCEFTAGCLIAVPFERTSLNQFSPVLVALAENSSAGDSTFSSQISSGLSTGLLGDIVYAGFTPTTATAVPEPASIVLLLAGLLGLAGLKRRHNPFGNRSRI